jgi:hypothetical protein
MAISKSSYGNNVHQTLSYIENRVVKMLARIGYLKERQCIELDSVPLLQDQGSTSENNVYGEHVPS